MAEIHKLSKSSQTGEKTIYPLTVTDAVIDHRTGHSLTQWMNENKRPEVPELFVVNEIRRFPKPATLQDDQYLHADGSAIFLQDYPKLIIPLVPTTVIVENKDIGLISHRPGYACTVQSICTGNGISVLVSTDGNTCYKLPAGEWVAGQRLTDCIYPRMAYGNGKFVAMDVQALYDSTNGKAWKKRTTNLPKLNSSYMADWIVLFDEELFVAYTSYSTPEGVGCHALYTSVDGITWMNRSANIPIQLFQTGGTVYKAACGNGIVAIPGNNSVCFSPDYINWQTVAIPENATGQWSIRFVNNRFILIGIKSVGSIPLIFETTDFVTFKKHNWNSTKILQVDHHLCYHSGMYFISDGLAVCYDGLNWNTPVISAGSAISEWVDDYLWSFNTSSPITKIYKFDGRFLLPALDNDKEISYIKVLE